MPTTTSSTTQKPSSRTKTTKPPTMTSDPGTRASSRTRGISFGPSRNRDLTSEATRTPADISHRRRNGTLSSAIARLKIPSASARLDLGRSP